MATKIKVGVAGIYHETNSFAPGNTILNDFKETWINKEKKYFDIYQGTRTSMGGVIDASNDLNIQLIPGLYTETTPSGMVTEKTIEVLISSLIDSISNNIDGLVLILHGAMVSESYPDVEGEILTRLRERFGNFLPIITTLDLHANISEEMVNHSDCIVGYDTYPHIDTYERAVEATKVLIKTIKGEIDPISAWTSARMLISPQTMLTKTGPMRTLIEYAWQLEENPNVINITVAGGFPYSDVPDAGMSFVVTTDRDEKLAKSMVMKLNKLAWKIRYEFKVKEVSVNDAAESTLKQKDGPVIWIEGSDNVGGGSPANATHVLKYLTTFEEASLIVIRDKEVAFKAHQLGVGKTINCELGGKSDELHGNPVPINGRIRLLSDGEFVYAGPYMEGKLGNMGKSAVIEYNHITIIVTENRIPPFDINHVKSVGIIPEKHKVIVVKSAVAWKTSFGNIAKNEIYLDTPGCTGSNINRFIYKNVKRPIFPIDKSD